MKVVFLCQVFIILLIKNTMIQGNKNIYKENHLPKLQRKENLIRRSLPSINMFSKSPIRLQEAINKNKKRHDRKRHDRKRNELETDDVHLIKTSTSARSKPAFYFNMDKFVKQIREILLNKDAFKKISDEIGVSEQTGSLNSVGGKLIEKVFLTTISHSLGSKENTQFNNVLKRKKCKYRARSKINPLPLNNSLKIDTAFPLATDANLQANKGEHKEHTDYLPLFERERNSKEKTKPKVNEMPYYEYKKFKEKLASIQPKDENHGKEISTTMRTPDLARYRSDGNKDISFITNFKNNIKAIDEDESEATLKNREITDLLHGANNLLGEKRKKKLMPTSNREEFLLRRQSDAPDLGSYVKTGYHRKKCKVRPPIKPDREKTFEKSLHTKDGDILLRISVENDQPFQVGNQNLSDNFKPFSMDVDSERRLQLSGYQGIKNIREQTNSATKKKCKIPPGEDIHINLPEDLDSHHYDEFDLLFNSKKTNTK